MLTAAQAAQKIQPNYHRKRRTLTAAQAAQKTTNFLAFG